MRKLLFIIILFFNAFVYLSALAAEKQVLKCNTGPVNKIYGKTNWLVYSCNDNATAVIVTDAGNPAMPFVFTLFKKDGGYQLTGEGAGSKEFADAAYNELKELSESDIKSLIAETRQSKY